MVPIILSVSLSGSDQGGTEDGSGTHRVSTEFLQAPQEPGSTDAEDGNTAHEVAALSPLIVLVRRL